LTVMVATLIYEMMMQMMILNYVKSIEMPTNGQKRCLIMIQTMI